MVIRMVIVLLSLTAATGYPADLLLERVLSHKHQLQLRPLTSRQIYSDSLLGLQRLSRQLKDVTTPPADGSESGRQVRLVGGPGPWEGAVEVHTAFGWHRVIATRWSEVEASVVCRQLGHVSFFRAAPLPYASLLSLDGTDDTPVNIHKCSGREASLLDCDQAAVEAPAPPVGVSCLSAEDLSERCGEGELPFGDSCYFVGRESVTRLKAELYCRQRNASLVVVNSQLKNDFLSGAISSMGLEGFHTAGRSHRIGKTETIWSWESSDAPFLFTKWNPDELSTEPLGVEQRCLTLEPSEAASVAELDYAFWASSDCSRRLQYVCETPRDWTDCARDVAGSYAGTVSTAESGRPCLPWSDVAGVSGLSSAALVANLCRNPDGDRGPWCFTGPDQFEYCNIAACPPHLPPPPSPKEDNYTCHSLQFACGNGRCTKVAYVCDGDRDCADGRDETVCSALPASFQTFDLMQVTFPASIRLIEAITSDSDISIRTCQFLCLADPSCYAVQYDILKKRCYRIVRPLGEFRVTRDPLSSVHVVLSRYRPCSGHRCDDFQCLNRTGVRCDGVRDCLDVSDELDCAAEAPVPLRLVDGAVAGSGRLEARFQGRWGAVCDDGFNSRSADVACRQLGFNRHRRMFLNGRGYPAAAGAAYYAVSFTACDGNEEQLADCILQSDENRCTDGEQVSLECTNETGICTLLPNFFECLDSSACVAPSQLCDGQRKCSDGSDESEDVCQGQKVRLVGDSQPPRVQVKPAGSVRPFLAVISRAFGEHEANFLCRSLGGGPYGVPVEDVRLLPEDEIVADVLCSSAANCSAQTTAPGPEARAVRLRCLTEKPPPPLLRLVGGNERSGLLELRPPLADWGRVCAATFNAAQAKVVCHQLGFSGESGFLETTRNLNITVSLRAMDCLGDENNIKECFRQPWANVTGPEVCGGSGEVYLSCDDPGKPSAPAAPLTPQCAADAADVDRVLGGRTAASGDLPAFARLQIFSGSAWKLRCGATVLSERFLLTAAHCVKPSTSDRLRGVDELPVSRLSMLVGGGQRVAVRRVIPHPGHGILSPHSDDLALVELERSLDFSADVQPACLPPQDTSYSPGLVCSVAGYGSTRPQRGPSATADASSALASDTLQVGNVTFFTRDECQGFYGRRNITLGMVCAGDERFEVDTCDGDSGGPLLCRLGDASVLMGVTSWGPGCGRPQQPGVYVRVASYVSWIRAVMQGAPAA